MTPEEKAKNLVESFSHLANNNLYLFVTTVVGDKQERIKNSKMCAIVTVHEIQKVDNSDY